MDELSLLVRLQALLFAEGGSISRKRLCTQLGCKEKELSDAFAALPERLAGSGISLITTETEASLCVAPEATMFVQKVFERELGKEIGESGLEVLAIVLYCGASTRARIDYIRGVNTSSTLRNLLSRGLLERTGNPEDAREYLYRPTVELLAHLGVRNNTELPNYEEVVSELDAFEAGAKSAADTDAAEQAS
jgi:segregation and condensation protein B